jgi:uncharacterized OsmC-like protein
MKTKVKWMGEAQFVVENTKNLNLVVTDSKYRAESGEPTCIDLILMGFAGCIYSEFRKGAELHRIPFDQSSTELVLEFSGDRSKPMVMKIHLTTRSRMKSDLIRSCLTDAINSSMPGILLSNTGIKYQIGVSVKSTKEVLYH